MAGVTGSISIKDNASATLKNIRSEQSKLREDAKKTSSALKSAWNTPRKLKADVSEAKKKLKSVTDAAKKLKPVTMAVKAKDTATKVIKGVGNAIKAVKKSKAVTAVLKAKDTASKVVKGTTRALVTLGRKVASPVIKVVDKASGAIQGITGKLGKVAKAAMIPIGIAAAAGTAAIGGSISAGMQLEQQQISIEHFVGATNKDLSPDEVKAQSQSYIEQLRTNANATPFETGEVIQAGSRAVSLAGGDTAAAMDMVKLAEDMAAASGGTKTIMDAMEALGDLKMGETERLKEFGFKVSADEFKKKGYGGVSGDLQGFFGGAAGKLAGSGAGLVSTITGKLKSNAADFGLGIVDQLKPVMSDVIAFIDGAQPTIQKFSAAFGQGLSKGIGLAKKAFTTIQPVISAVVSQAIPLVSELVSSFSAQFRQLQPVISTIVSQVIPLVSGLISNISANFQRMQPVIGMAISMIGPTIMTLIPIFQQASTIIGSVASGISTAIAAVAPVIVSIMSGIGEKIGGVVEFLAERSGFIQDVISTVGPAIAEVLSTAWSIISPVMDILITTFELVFGVVQKVWPGIQDIISSVWDVLKPIFDTIGKGADLLAGAWSKVKNLVVGDGGGGESDGGTSPGKNAGGDNNWRGGPTWVGEKGPELIDLPHGTRILPTKESAAWAASQDSNILQLPQRSYSSLGQSMTAGGSQGKIQTVQINKLADNITVRSDDDIDQIAEQTAKKIIEELDNIA